MVRDGRHAFVDSGIADRNGVRQCDRCPLPETNEIHALPEVDDEQRAAEMRRTGERE